MKISRLFLPALLLAAILWSLPALAQCVVGGCSGQLCLRAGEDVAGTCEWNDKYACYPAHGECAEQADGSCAWTATPALVNCLSNPPPSNAVPPAPPQTEQPSQPLPDAQMPDQSHTQQPQQPQAQRGMQCLRVGSFSQSCVDLADAIGHVPADFDNPPDLPWNDAYLCYSQYGQCVRLADGNCGWVDPGDLQNCLVNPANYVKLAPVTAQPGPSYTNQQ